MKFIGDFHIHSHFSIATSKELTPEHLEYWAQGKGISLVGTGDFSHPGWLSELREKLEPAEEGLFKLKEQYRLKDLLRSSGFASGDVRFMLTAEISNIYKKNGRVRKVHNVIFAPDFETVEKIQKELSRRKFNITSDGRPILGMDSEHLLDLCLQASPNIFFVPAHIWTPWFSVLGANSGFDSISECYGSLSQYIFAVEMGLSSHPPMNWMCSFLDQYTLIANSDAHSPEKLGRNACLFNTTMSYPAVIDALKTGNPDTFLGTVNFFPQEGKYHFAGHRKCSICWNPVETVRHNSICTVCGKPVTLGVMNRLAQLSGRTDLSERKNRHPFYSCIPLKEILSEMLNSKVGTKKVQQAYFSIIRKAGNEFNLLLNLPVQDIASFGDPVLAEAIRRMRNSEVHISEGYDGEFGRIKVFQDNEQKRFSSQEFIFNTEASSSGSHKHFQFDLNEYRALEKSLEKANTLPSVHQQVSVLEDQPAGYGLNPEQQKAVEHVAGPALIMAGPGTGKTHVLACRIKHLVTECGIPPEQILAVTFTNKAAREMQERLVSLFTDPVIADKITVCTFHAFGYNVLSRYFGEERAFHVAGEEDKKYILQKEMKTDSRGIKKISAAISSYKQQVKSPADVPQDETGQLYALYQDYLEKHHIVDLDDLVSEPVKMFTRNSAFLQQFRETYRWMLVDEYQDVNLAQYSLIRILMPEQGSNLCVIGDPNQAIYGFRGADVRYIHQFIQDYPQASVYNLIRSYRCSSNILRASGEVILTGKKSEKFLEGLQDNMKIKIVPNKTDRSEAEYIARTIEQMIGGLRFYSMDTNLAGSGGMSDIHSLSDFAVLCRVKEQMKVIEQAFRNHTIPYQMIGDTPFFSQHPVDAVISIIQCARQPGLQFLENKLMQHYKILPKDIDYVKQFINDRNIKDTVIEIMQKYFISEEEPFENILQNLSDLSAGFGKDYEGFLKYTTLGAGADAFRKDTEQVTLMTLHAAKGLEFTCVFIAGCEDGLIPYSLFDTQPADREEEKRLMYVGMTRAKKYLYLTYSAKRMMFNREYRMLPSPYIGSIEKELLEISKVEYRKPQKKQDDQLNLFDDLMI